MSAPTPRYMLANGVRFAYFEEGAGPLVLLLHGFPDTAHSWDAVRPALAAAGYRAVSPFTRGYFPTAVPDNGAYDTVTLGCDALALITALGAESAVIVGHDWGAATAYAAAVLDPKRVSFLLTVATPHPGAVRPFPRVVWGVRHMYAFQSRRAEQFVRADDFAYIDTLVRRWSPSWHVPEDETRAVKQAFAQPGCLTGALGYYRAIRLNAPKALRHRITVPSAVFCGDDDPVLRLSDYERARSHYAGAYEIIRMPGGHFLHREYPEQFIRELLRVLPPPPARTSLPNL